MNKYSQSLYILGESKLTHSHTTIDMFISTTYDKKIYMMDNK